MGISAPESSQHRSVEEKCKWLSDSEPPTGDNFKSSDLTPYVQYELKTCFFIIIIIIIASCNGS